MKTEELLNRQWLTIKDAARFLGVSQDTLRRWEKKGTLMPRRTVGGHRRYAKAQLERVLRQPITTIINQQRPTEDKKEHQIASPLPAAPSVSPHQTYLYTSKTINTYTKIIKGIKDNLITLITTLIIVFLILASFLLLQTSKKQTEPQFVSPIPSSN